MNLLNIKIGGFRLGLPVIALFIALRLEAQVPVSSFDSLVNYPRLEIERSLVYSPSQGDMFSHHPYLVYFNGKYIAMWSNGVKDEDDPRQKVVLSYSSDFKNWTKPEPLALPGMDEVRIPEILTAAGFYEYHGTLVAYYGSYSKLRTHTRLLAKTTRDGVNWSEEKDLHIPVIPNHPPRKLENGRLIICGNFSFPYTDNLNGIEGWKMSGFYPAEMEMVSDNPWSFWKISKGMGLTASLCEGSFYQTEDQVIHMMLRSAGESFKGVLWATESGDNGSTWTRPVESSFPDNDHKFQFGRLPDGRYYYLGCPVSFPRGRRCPLVFSLSSDGKSFTQHFIVASEPYDRKSDGRYKEGQYGYPSAFIKGDRIYLIVSRQKEGVEAINFKIPPVQ